MTDQRPEFHAALNSLEETTLSMAEKVEGMVDMAVRALVNSDQRLVSQVIESDDVVDEIYMEIRSRWMHIMARQQPMGRDLRMMAAILEMNNTLERMGDQSVNIAKIARATAGLPREETILAKVQEMGDLLKPMIRTAIDAFVRRDAEECRLLPAMDVPVDVLNRQHVEACGGVWAQPRLAGVGHPDGSGVPRSGEGRRSGGRHRRAGCVFDDRGSPGVLRLHDYGSD